MTPVGGLWTKQNVKLVYIFNVYILVENLDIISRSSIFVQTLNTQKNF